MARPSYLDCCIHEELSHYYIPRRFMPYCATANIVFILLVIGVNLIINAFSKRKT